MITAVDSSVLLDVLGADARFGPRSREALRGAYDSGALVACDIVWAEVRAHFADDDAFASALEALGVRYDGISAEASSLAGRLWREHRTRAAGRRHRLVADFLIGAHAAKQADSLLTRDRGFYRAAFADLDVIDPSVRP